MLTGDLNILQGRWNVIYRVKRDDASILKYYNTVGSKENERDEKRLIKVVLQSAVLREISRLGVFDAYPRGKTALPALVKNTMKKILDALDCGIQVEQITLIDIRPPKEVKPAFDAVLAAQQGAAQIKTDAEREAHKTLIDAAGEVGIELGKTIGQWWDAKQANRTADMKAIEARISKLFREAGGKAKATIAEALAYKTSIVEEAKGDAAQITSLLGNRPQDVKIFLDHARVEAIQEVLAKCYEKFLYRPIGSKTRGELEIWLNRRPELLRQMRKVQETR